jgi:hypothetical protein
MYEELEVLAAFHEYLRLAGDDVLPALRILLPEYCKYVIDRTWYHYPSELPADVLAEKARSGHVNRRISIPLEDLSEGWKKAGEVGQEVYGAAAPFVFSTRHAHLIPGEEFVIHSNYPAGDLEVEKSAEGGRASLQMLGDHRCECQVRIVPSNFTPLPEVSLSVQSRRGREAPEGHLTEAGSIEYDLPGDARVSIRWERAAPGDGASMPANHREEGEKAEGSRGRRSISPAKPTSGDQHGARG